MRARLALLVTAVSVLIVIAFLVPLALLLRTAAEDRATSRATANAQSLAPVVGTADVNTVRLTVEQLVAESGRPVSVFLPDGTVLGTQSAPTPAVELAARGQSLTAETADGREVVIAVQGRTDGITVIRAVVPYDEMTAGVDRAWLVLALLGLLLVLIALAVADRLARTLVRPIGELSAVSHRLARAELDARVDPSGPAELREVGGALNHLAGRIQELLVQEREQVADLSHRLRTPLTALRLEAESLRDPQDAARVTDAVDGLERAVTGLIRQARWHTRADSAAVTDAVATVADRVAFWSVLAEETGRRVDLDLAPGPLPVNVSTDELAAAVDALLGNVFAHTPDSTAFAVRLVPAGDQVVLTVADEGPGIAADSVRRGASQAGSTGLGLDIARRAAQASGGRLELGETPGGGAAVTLRLGSPKP
ncbi:Signal transduction histidine kinase [Micromonospora phaseoli]|uniref:histidine kinase n=1 Tax=Micromonospora phaseoli TaxID=1144548 RepID=A0A1H7CT59_9ACTN|nr:HAMP domain-containing sensor histidine kinase [Micromonospora phaseoli]PZV91561.1 signal transduction histidine kinase [Micromonospora phaseoli]GIJ80779.1 two-component sensor histidine kinase [Micromonospora phaseoli]SEJ92394.1 Signal transduction histidine kinase [Micromonospora phaseoli]